MIEIDGFVNVDNPANNDDVGRGLYVKNILGEDYRGFNV